MKTTIEVEASGFATLPLIEPLQRALAEKKYFQPSPIQGQAIPHLLRGKDLIGIAQTGTGKTAAFALPILQRLAEHSRARVPQRPRALVLAPTRELAAQIRDSFVAYGKHLHFKTAVVFGGVGYARQIQELRRGVDVLIATPGRLLDLAEQNAVKFDGVEVFVLDEADRMLDMGFIHDIRRILGMLPSKRQSLLFSATMPAAIEDLAGKLLHQPVNVAVTPVATPVEKIQQKVCYVDRSNKHALLLHFLEKHPEGLVLIFAQTKHGANRLAERLARDKISAEAIHGNKSQGARERALESFRRGKARVLVATDIAARGIDVKGISLVVNYDLPHEPESYVHRIGRTARAGAEGLAIAFCDREERDNLRAIQKLIKQVIPVIEDHPFAKVEVNPVTLESDRSQGRFVQQKTYRGMSFGFRKKSGPSFRRRRRK